MSSSEKVLSITTNTSLDTTGAYKFWTFLFQVFLLNAMPIETIDRRLAWRQGIVASRSLRKIHTEDSDSCPIHYRDNKMLINFMAKTTAHTNDTLKKKSARFSLNGVERLRFPWACRSSIMPSWQ